MKKLLSTLGSILFCTLFSFSQNDFATEVENSAGDLFHSTSVSSANGASINGVYSAGYLNGGSSGFVQKTDEFGNSLWQQKLSSLNDDAVFVRTGVGGDAIVAYSTSAALRVSRFDDNSGSIQSTEEVTGSMKIVSMKDILVSGFPAIGILAFSSGAGTYSLHFTALNTSGNILYTKKYDAPNFLEFSDYNTAGFEQRGTGNILMMYGTSFGYASVEIISTSGALVSTSVDFEVFSSSGNTRISDILEIPAVIGTGSNYVIAGSAGNYGLLGILDNSLNVQYLEKIDYGGVSLPRYIVADIELDGSEVQALITHYASSGSPNSGIFARFIPGTSSFSFTSSTELYDGISNNFIFRTPSHFDYFNSTPVFASYPIALSGTGILSMNNSYNLSGCALGSVSESITTETLSGSFTGVTAISTPASTSVSLSNDFMTPKSTYQCNAPCAGGIAGVSKNMTGGICSTGGGSILLTVTPPAGSYLYTWSVPGEISNSVSVTTVGNYTVTIIDQATGCKQVETFTVVADEDVTSGVYNISPAGINLCVNDNPHNFNISPVPTSTSPVYDWDFGFGITSNSDSPNISFGNNFGTRTIELDYTNACGTITLTDNIDVVGFESDIIVQNPVCFGDQGCGTVDILAEASGNTYTYNWLGAFGNATECFNAGLVNVTVTDNNGCSSVEAFGVPLISAPLNATVASTTNETCVNADDGSITISVTGGVAPYTYAWSGSSSTSNTANNLAPGSYSYTVTDNNGCIETGGPVTINSATGLGVANSVVITNASCVGIDDGEIEASVASGSATFNWSTGFNQTGVSSSTIVGLAAGTYGVTITNATGCIEESYTIIQPDAEWTVHSESSDNTETVDIEKDDNGNIYILGTFSGQAYFNHGVVSISSGLAPEGTYLAKYNPCGEFQWVAYSSNSLVAPYDNGIDIELVGSNIYLLSFVSVPGSYGYQVKDFSNSTLGTPLPSGAGSFSQYNVLRLDITGNLLNSSDVSFSINYELTSIQPNPQNLPNVFLAGRDNSINDAFIGEFTLGTQYAVTGNTTSPTGLSSINRVNDLEYYENPTGNPVLHACGTFDSDPMSLGFSPVVGTSDAFVSIHQAGSLSSAGFGDVAGSDGTGEAVEIDDVSFTGGAEIFVAGNYEGVLLNWNGLDAGGVTNAFMVHRRFIGGAYSSSWGYTLDAPLSTMNRALGAGVDVQDGGEFVHFTGVVDAPTFEVSTTGIFQTGTMGIENMWNAGFNIGGALEYLSSVTSPLDMTSNGVVSNGANIFATGSFTDNLEYNTSPTLAPLAHPNAGINENFVVRYGNYFGIPGEYHKHDPSTNHTFEEDLEKRWDISILPNPSNGQFRLVLNRPNIVSEGFLEIFGLKGQMIHSEKIPEGTIYRTTINLSQVAGGVYLVRIHSENYSQTERLVVF